MSKQIPFLLNLLKNRLPLFNSLIVLGLLHSPFNLFSNNQDGNSTEVYFLDWDGSTFLVSGNGYTTEPIPHLTLYENNYYIFNNLSDGIRLCIGENNQTIYSADDIWNNNAVGDDEYILFNPTVDSPRTLYYFNPENANSAGQITILNSDSNLFYPQTRIQEAKFGKSVSINDWNQTIIGAPGESELDGVIYVFNLESNGTYTQIQKIINPVLSSAGQFGDTVITEGQFLAVSSPDYDSFSGAVYLYERESNGTYKFLQELSTFSKIGDNFGWDVSIYGDLMAVTSLEANNSKSGKVLIFENNGTSWNFDANFTSDDNVSEDRFGFDSSIFENRLLVGVPKADANGANSGAAYIFERNQSIWSQSKKISPDDLSSDDEFGYAVALSGDLAFVSARQRDIDGNTTNAGVVYVFSYDGGDWNEINQINPDQNTSGQFFGSDLVIYEDILGISSTMQEEGYLYLYRVEDNGSTISLISRLSLEDANSTDASHLSIAITRGLSVVGIPGESSFEDAGGGALVFYNDGWEQVNLPTLSPIIDFDTFDEVTIQEDSGIYTYDFNGSHPFDSNLTWSVSSTQDLSASISPSTGIFQFSPEGNFSGVLSFEIQLSNGVLNDSHDFNVTVEEVNDAPVFLSQSSLLQGMVGDDYNNTIDVFDDENDTLTITSADLPGWLSLDGQNLVGTPVSIGDKLFDDFNFTLQVSDGSLSSSRTFNLVILERNEAPLIFVDGNSSVRSIDITLDEDFDENQWYASLPHLDFNDSDGHTLFLTHLDSPLYGTLTSDINATDRNESVLYIPNPDFYGTETFTIKLDENVFNPAGDANKSDTLLFNITINPINDPPEILSVPPDSPASANEGVLFSYSLLFADPELNDPNFNESLSVTFENLPGWLSYDSNLSILSGTPAWSDYEESGPRQIVIRVEDSFGSQDSQVFTLQVIPNNYPPVITEGPTFFATVDEDSNITDWSPLNLDAVEQDLVLGNLTWTILSPPVYGNATVVGTGTRPSSLIYVPEGNFTGSDSFELKVYDSADLNASDLITINIDVTPQPDNPVFTSLTSGIAVKDYLYDYNITSYDADADANLSINTLVALPSWLNFLDNGNGTARLWGTPDQYDIASNLILLEVRDETRSFTIQSFTLSVLEYNKNPVITQGETISFTHVEDTLWNGSSLISATDEDGQFLEWSVLSAPLNGDLSISGLGNSPPILNYIPDGNFTGSDSFQVQVSDGIGTDSILIQLNIQNVEDAPVFITPISNQSTIDTQNFEVEFIAYDAEGLLGADISMNLISWLSIKSVDYDSGRILLGGVPTVADEGNNTVSLEVIDSTGLSVSSTFLIDVIVLNYPPEVNSGDVSVTVSMTEDILSSWISPSLTANDFETPSSDLEWSVFIPPIYGEATVGGFGENPTNFVYQPDGNFSGTDFFTVGVTDAGGLDSSPPKSDTIIVYVNVQPVNDPPVFRSIPVSDTTGKYRWNDESSYVYDIKTFDADWNYSWHSLDLNISSVLPEWLTFEDDGNGTGKLYGLAAVADEGNYTISFQLTDSNQTDANQTFQLQIEVDNYPPVFQAISTSKIISELFVYIDEDSSSNELRGWSAPSDYFAYDPDPELSVAQPLTWTFEHISNSGADVNASGVGDRPGSFTYSPALNFYGVDMVNLKVNDGHRYSVLPVRIKVRPLPDAPVFYPSPDRFLVAKEGARFNLDIITFDPDDSPRTIRVLGLPSGGNSWLQLIDQNSTLGTARLSGVPPSYSSGDRYQLAFVVTDDTGRFSLANSQLIVDGKNLSPLVSVGSETTIRFDKLGNASPSDMAKLYATDREGDHLVWALSDHHTPSYGFASVIGNGVQTPFIKYLSYSSGTQDSFSVKVTDGTSSEEVKITAIVVDKFDTFEVIQPDALRDVPTGHSYADYFRVVTSKKDSDLSMVLLEGPTWLNIERIGNGLFKLFGEVPLNTSEEILLEISFIEDGAIQKSIQHVIKTFDYTLPEILKKGSDFIQVRIGQSYSEPGYLAKSASGEDLNESVQVVGSVDQANVSLQTLNYKIVHSDGNFSQVSRTVQVIDSNYSVEANEIIEFPENTIKGFSSSSSSLITIEEISSTESTFNKYKKYNDLSNPDLTLNFKATKLNLHQCISIDSGGFLLSGVFRGNLEFGQNLVVSKGNHDLFLMKLDSYFQIEWFKVVSSTSVLENIQMSGIKDNSILLSGNFSGELFMGSQNWKSQGNSDNFIWNLDSQGETLWLKTFGGDGVEELVDVEFFTTGSFITLSNTFKSDQPSYFTVVKFNSDGSIVDGVSFNQLNSNSASGLTVDDENIYLIGKFDNELDLNGEVLTSNLPVSSGFICSLNEDFDINWAEVFSSTAGTEFIGLEVDPFGSLFALLNFEGNQTTEGGSISLISQGMSDSMVLKLDPLTGNRIWQKNISTPGDDKSIGLIVDRYGMLFIGVTMETPFFLDGRTVEKGNQFLLKLGSSFWGNPVFQSIEDLELKENHFFQQSLRVINPSFVRLKMMESPSWMVFRDNEDGTAILGGIPKGDFSGSEIVKVRGFTVDGGFSDLDINYSVEPEEQTGLFQRKLPIYKTAINFGNNVSISMINEDSNGDYFIGGKFVNNFAVEGKYITAVGLNDGFISRMEANGTIISYVHLVSEGILNIGSALTARDGDTYVMGHFSGQLRTGEFLVQSVGGSDLFVLQWGTDGNVKNLSTIGGPFNEYFKVATTNENKLYLAGTYEDEFSHGKNLVKSLGGADGFVLQVNTNDIDTVEWIQSFGGINDEKVSSIQVLDTGQLVLGGTYSSTGYFGTNSSQSLGMNDCFMAFFNDDGNWQKILSFGGGGNDELTGLVPLSNDNFMVVGNFFGSFKCGNKKVSSNGKSDGFVAIINAAGSCISLKSYGGVGSDSINSLSHTDGQIYFTGTFSNQIDLGSKEFSTRGVRDSFIALFDEDEKSILDCFQLGGGGEDATTYGGSSFSGNILLAGVSDGLMGNNGFTSPSIESKNGYLFLLANHNDQNKTNRPVLSPSPLTEIPSSTLYEYKFSTGPWTKGRDIIYTLIEKPAWLNIKIDEDGNGIAWGHSPSLTGLTEVVKFDLKSSFKGSIRCHWEINIISDLKSVYIVGEPPLVASKGLEYSANFKLVGGNNENTLLFPKEIPTWLSLSRDEYNQISLSGVPTEYGIYKVDLLAHKYIDQNRSHQDLRSFQIKVQPKIIESSTSANVGNWRTNWLGYFHTFENLWTYHEDFSWIYIGDGNHDNDIWFWTEKWGWLWTSSEHWNNLISEGFLYSSQSDEWLFFRSDKSSQVARPIIYSYEKKVWLDYK